VGAIESEDACVAWREEYGLEFPVVADEDGSLFRALTNGWVPWSVLVGPDGKVVFSENEFDEAGFAAAIEQMYEQPTPTRAPRVGRRAVGRAGCTVVLGGGTGGLVAARELRRRLPAEQRIVLVDRQREHVFRPSLLWQMVGARRPSQFSRPLARLARAGIEFRNAEVLSLDLDASVVDTTSGDLAYDWLVIALGASLAPEEVPGFEEMAHNLYTPAGCARIHTALSDLRGGVVAVLVPELPFMCPAAPYEAAFLAESFIRERGIRRNVEIHVFSPEHTPMPVAPAALGESVEELMAARGIHYHPLFTFQQLRPETGEIVASDGHAHHVDLLMLVPPHRAPDVIRASPLLGLSGFVHADRNTLQTSYDDVYAIGDVATIKLPNGKALPKAGVFAHAEAKTVATRIAQTAAGDTPNAAFDGHGHCWIELGDGRAGFAGGNFYADPEPQIKLHRPGRHLHWGKIAFEKWWLHHWL
jgi:sulfide:quinone oxidoreductase